MFQQVFGSRYFHLPLYFTSSLTGFEDSSLLSSLFSTWSHILSFFFIYLMIPGYCFHIRDKVWSVNQHLPFLFQHSTRLIHFLDTRYETNPPTCQNSTFNLSILNECRWLVLTSLPMTSLYSCQIQVSFVVIWVSTNVIQVRYRNKYAGRNSNFV